MATKYVPCRLQLLPDGDKRTRKTTAIAAIVEVLFLAFLLLIPLYYTDSLPTNLMQSVLLVAPPPPPPPPPPAPAQVVHVVRTAHLMQHGQLVAPRVIPREVRIIHEDATPPEVGGAIGGVPGGVEGGTVNGVLGGVIGSVTHTAAPPPPPTQVKRITVGGQVTAAKLVNRVTPQYPPLARQTRVSGAVKLHAIISKDGSIMELSVISGHPLLVQAAISAVKEWRYQPTLLNGQPVEVETTIDVLFNLQQ